MTKKPNANEVITRCMVCFDLAEDHNTCRWNACNCQFHKSGVNYRGE